MENESFENEIVFFELREGILYGKYKVLEIDLAKAKAATIFRHKITGGKKMPAIADLSMVKQVTKETREYFSSAQAGEDLSALALIVNNPVIRTMGNFFLKLHKPQYPFRLFTNLDEATSWIKKSV